MNKELKIKYNKLLKEEKILMKEINLIKENFDIKFLEIIKIQLKVNKIIFKSLK